MKRKTYKEEQIITILKPTHHVHIDMVPLTGFKSRNVLHSAGY